MSRGDGLLNIVRAFNKAIAGLSDRDTATYAQAFMGKFHCASFQADNPSYLDCLHAVVVSMFQIRQKRQGHRPKCQIMGIASLPTQFRATPPTWSHRRRSRLCRIADRS